MCGRAAQTYHAVQAARTSLEDRMAGGCGSSTTGRSSADNDATTTRTTATASTARCTTRFVMQEDKDTTESSLSLSNQHSHTAQQHHSSAATADDDNGQQHGATTTVDDEQQHATTNTDQDEDTTRNNNYNMSPGMDAYVFYKDDNNIFKLGRKTWGLISRGGTKTNPLSHGMSKHFDHLMFNARSDTLYEKPTFARLANSQKTCLIAVDGFFEWKQELKNVKKQPYFVYRKINRNNNNNSSVEEKGDNSNEINNQEQDQHRPYLLFAGLWTSVATGYPEGKPTTLDTFTILTTDACPKLQWLHTRMPVMIWDEKLALSWLNCPSKHVLDELLHQANDDNNSLLQWHAVTPQMSSMKFRTKQAIQPMPKYKTVSSFFRPSTISAEAKKEKSNNNDKTITKSSSSIKNSSDNKEPQESTTSTTTATTTTPPSSSAPTTTGCSNKNSKQQQRGKDMKVSLTTKNTTSTRKRTAAMSTTSSTSSNNNKASGKKKKSSKSRKIDSFFQPKNKDA